MDKNFETSIDDLNLSAESLITTFEENLFWSPNELIFTNWLEYLEQVISKENAVANGKIEAIRIKHSIEQKMEQIRYSKSTYWIYSEEDERCLNMILENLNNAIKIYSER